MPKIDEVDKLLSDPNYIYDDGFWVFYELAETFKEKDWLELIKISKTRDKEWNDNLLYAQPFERGSISEVLPFVFNILGNEQTLAVRILSQLDTKALSKHLSDGMIGELAEVWKSQPELRNDIKAACRDAQKTGLLRKILCLNSWDEVGAKYPTST